MRRTRFDDAACPIARTTDLMGDDRDGEPLSDRELASILFGLSFAGHETTTNQATNCIRRIIENGLWPVLKADRSLIDGVIEESLRHDSSVVAWRRITTRETELGGVRLPKGAKIMISRAAARRKRTCFCRIQTQRASMAKRRPP